MTLEQIKQAIAEGKRVKWGNDAYDVILSKSGKYLIVCSLNQDTIGLTWADGVTMNGKAEDFYITGPDLQATIQRMKSEILADIAAGLVPASVASFSELHDYVDANEYGGFCDDEAMTTILELQNERDSLDEEALRNWPKAGELDELDETYTRLANDAQNAINAWIASGVLKGVDITLNRIAQLQAIQKKSKPKSRVWELASNELAPLFKQMRAIVTA